MPKYDAGVTIDGWARIRIEAANRQEAEAKIRTGRPRFVVLDPDTFAVLGHVESSMFVVEPEEVELYRPEDEQDYHSPSRGSVDLS